MTKIPAHKALKVAKKAPKTKLPADKDIDFSDAPKLSAAQLKKFKRVGPGRPPFGPVARKLISIKVAPEVLESLKEEAQDRQIGYQTLIHEILEDHISDHKPTDRAAKRR